MNYLPSVVESVAQARTAQASWRQTSVRERLRLVRRVRWRLAESCEDIALAAASPAHPQSEVMLSEMLPLLEACRFLERSAGAILEVKRLSGRGLPWWLWGVASEIHREPFGVVGVISPSNYPLFLAGVQILQALVAGNAVVWKPAAGCAKVSAKFVELLLSVNLPSGLVQLLPDTAEAGIALTQTAIDKLLFTGGFDNGVHVLKSLAENAVPAVAELSGNDPVFVRADADLTLVAKALQFGTMLNQGRTCMAPRKVFAVRGLIAEVETAIKSRFATVPLGGTEAAGTPKIESLIALINDALRCGARLIHGEVQPSGIRFPCVIADVTSDMEIFRADLFFPVLLLLPVESEDEALQTAASSGYALAASVFSKDLREASRLCHKINAGLVSVNDLIVPSADPRIAFGGSGKSGYGVTRGREGLLALTRGKVIQVRKRGSLQHLESNLIDPMIAGAVIRVMHAGGLRSKWSAFLALCQRSWRRSPTA